MTVFFLVVGLEIKRELVTGELRDLRRAALPVVAAVGGMLVPAAIYLAFTAGTDAAPGFGIAMPTDIVFVLAVLTLARNAPAGLKAFLLTLAIVDDLGSIGIVAFAYASDVDPVPLVVAFVLFVAYALAVADRGPRPARVRRPRGRVVGGARRSAGSRRRSRAWCSRS